MTLRNQDASCFLGESIELDYSLVDVTGAPYVIPENISMSWTLSENAHDEALITKTSDDGGIIVDTENSGCHHRTETSGHALQTSGKILHAARHYRFGY